MNPCMLISVLNILASPITVASQKHSARKNTLVRKRMKEQHDLIIV